MLQSAENLTLAEDTSMLQTGAAGGFGRFTHRRTTDGRLCAGEYTQGGVTYSDCTTAANPDGVAGREWCYVEDGVAGKAYDYCAPAVDYAALRRTLSTDFAAKGTEMHDTI